MKQSGGENRLFSLLVVVLALFARVSFVHAIPSIITPTGTCNNNAADFDASANFTCTFTDSEVTQLDGKVLTTVDWNASTKILHITLTNNGLPASVTILGDVSFGFNSSALSIGTVSGDFPSGWSAGCSGFGPFKGGGGNFADCDGSSSGPEHLDFTYHLAGTVTGATFDSTTSKSGAHFVEHIKFSTNPTSSCSAWYGDANVSTTDILTGGECNGPDTFLPRPTPEPSSLILLGSGLLALARATRKKRD